MRQGPNFKCASFEYHKLDSAEIECIGKFGEIWCDGAGWLNDMTSPISLIRNMSVGNSSRAFTLNVIGQKAIHLQYGDANVS